MDAAANNAGGVGPGVYAIITSTGAYQPVLMV